MSADAGATAAPGPATARPAGHPAPPPRWAQVLALVGTTAGLAGNGTLALVAPVIFAHAAPPTPDFDRAVAGAVFGDILAAWFTVLGSLLFLVVPLFVTLLWKQPWHGWRSWKVRLAPSLLLVGVVLSLVGAHQGFERARAQRERVAAMAAQLSGDPAAPGADPAALGAERERFATLHRHSSMRFAFHSLLLAATVLQLSLSLGRRERNPLPGAPRSA